MCQKHPNAVDLRFTRTTSEYDCPPCNCDCGGKEPAVPKTRSGMSEGSANTCAILSGAGLVLGALGGPVGAGIGYLVGGSIGCVLALINDASEG